LSYITGPLSYITSFGFLEVSVPLKVMP
jgi:hypothetical protein